MNGMLDDIKPREKSGAQNMSARLGLKVLRSKRVMESASFFIKRTDAWRSVN